jgi:hypothetical protein
MEFLYERRDASPCRMSGKRTPYQTYLELKSSKQHHILHKAKLHNSTDAASDFSDLVQVKGNNKKPLFNTSLRASTSPGSTKQPKEDDVSANSSPIGGTVMSRPIATPKQFLSTTSFLKEDPACTARNPSFPTPFLHHPVRVRGKARPSSPHTASRLKTHTSYDPTLSITSNSSVATRPSTTTTLTRSPSTAPTLTRSPSSAPSRNTPR